MATFSTATTVSFRHWLEHQKKNVLQSFKQCNPERACRFPRDLLPDQHSTLVMDVLRCSPVLVPWSGEMMRGGGAEQF
ncbi:unnamed protein product [Boreogadus saida]